MFCYFWLQSFQDPCWDEEGAQGTTGICSTHFFFQKQASLFIFKQNMLLIENTERKCQGERKKNPSVIESTKKGEHFDFLDCFLLDDDDGLV